MPSTAHDDALRSQQGIPHSKCGPEEGLREVQKFRPWVRDPQQGAQSESMALCILREEILQGSAATHSMRDSNSGET